MKKFLSRLTRIVLVVTIPFIIFTIIDFLTEITGGRLGDYLQDHYGITKKPLFVVLLGLLFISLSYQIYEKWNEENTNSSSANSQNILLNIENLADWIENQYKSKYGKQVEVSFEVNSDEEIISHENNDFVRTQKANGIKIFPSEKVYARLTSKDFDWRKEFTVRYPVIEGLKSESINHKINSIFNYEKVFDVSLIESIEGDTWLSELDYEVKFLQKPFLNLILHMEGIGAYPWHDSQAITVNVETGERIKITDLFKEESLKRLAYIVDEFVQLDLRKASLKEIYINEIPLNPEEETEEFEVTINWLKERFGHEKVTVDDLNNFSLDEYGITFIHDFGFPHVIKALEPEGQYYFEYSSLKQFIKENSILEKFIQENLPGIYDNT